MPDASFADHFSASAAEYARFRPHYPPALFEWLGGIVRQRRVAWDCATGNGQAAVALAGRFDTVIATDGSAAQLAAATPHPRVRYACATAERSCLRSASVDLVTVAQALHWFDLGGFYEEVDRVVVADGVIAVWSYGPIAVDARIDPVVDELYHGTLGDWWPSERAHVDNGYRDLDFPFARIESPPLAMRERWSLGALLGYIGTWSAVQRYRKARGDDELQRFAARLGDAWGDPERTRSVRWQLMIRAGRVQARRA
jgi:hypothetical protein